MQAFGHQWTQSRPLPLPALSLLGAQTRTRVDTRNDLNGGQPTLYSVKIQKPYSVKAAELQLDEKFVSMFTSTF